MLRYLHSIGWDSIKNIVLFEYQNINVVCDIVYVYLCLSVCTFGLFLEWMCAKSNWQCHVDSERLSEKRGFWIHFAYYHLSSLLENDLKRLHKRHFDFRMDTSISENEFNHIDL
jgi:hypothetical protein